MVHCVQQLLRSKAKVTQHPGFTITHAPTMLYQFLISSFSFLCTDRHIHTNKQTHIQTDTIKNSICFVT